MSAGVRRGDLLITPLQYRFGGAYRTRLGSDVRPPEGAKFLWIEIAVENVGEHAADAPSPYDFLVRYKGEDIRADSLLFLEPSGMSAYQGERIYPGVRRTGWLRFTIPAGAQAEDLVLVLSPPLSFQEEAIWRLNP